MRGSMNQTPRPSHKLQRVGASLPDFLDFVYLEGLMTTRPDFVEINR